MAEAGTRLEGAWQQTLNIWIRRFGKAQATIRELEDERELDMATAFAAGWEAHAYHAGTGAVMAGLHKTRSEAWDAWWAKHNADGT